VESSGLPTKLRVSKVAVCCFSWGIFIIYFIILFYFIIHPKVQGGRTINESVVQEIKEDFLTHKGLDQVLILALGDNQGYIVRFGQCSVFLIPINKRRRWKLVLSLTDGALYCS
jgi:hypothetical protein